MANSDINAIATDLDNLSWEAMIDAINEEGREFTFNELKIAAQKYLFVVESLSNQLLGFQMVLKRQSEIRKANRDIYNELDEYIANKQEISYFLAGEIPKKLYATSLEFQELLNKILGQKVVMVFVYEGDDGPELYEMKGHDLLKYDYSSSNQLAARYRVTTSDLNTALEQLKLDEQMNQDFLNGVKSTYMEVLYRYRCSRQVGKRVVLWYLNNNWNAMKVSAEGDINEAYASFVILNDPPPTFQNDMEQNVADFMNEGVRNVDNISGLLQGDVRKNGLEYAIKSMGASTLSLKQIQTLAKRIVSEEGFDKEKLLQVQKELQAKGRTRNKTVKLVEKEVDEVLSIIKTNRK